METPDVGDSSRRFTVESLRMSGGLLVWAGHLGAVYAIAGVVCARGWANRPLFGLPAIPLAVALLTAVALVATALLLRDARERRGRGDDDGGRRFVAKVAAWVAGFSLLAILWTALVVLLVKPPCPGEPRVGGGLAAPAPAGPALPGGPAERAEGPLVNAPAPGGGRQSAANAMVDSRAFAAWRESRRVCWTTTGTSDSTTLA